METNELPTVRHQAMTAWELIQYLARNYAPDQVVAITDSETTWLVGPGMNCNMDEKMLTLWSTEPGIAGLLAFSTGKRCPKCEAGDADYDVDKVDITVVSPTERFCMKCEHEWTVR